MSNTVCCCFFICGSVFEEFVVFQTDIYLAKYKYCYILISVPKKCQKAREHFGTVRTQLASLKIKFPTDQYYRWVCPIASYLWVKHLFVLIYLTELLLGWKVTVSSAKGGYKCDVMMVYIVLSVWMALDREHSVGQVLALKSLQCEIWQRDTTWEVENWQEYRGAICNLSIEVHNQTTSTLLVVIIIVIIKTICFPGGFKKTSLTVQSGNIHNFKMYIASLNLSDVFLIRFHEHWRFVLQRLVFLAAFVVYLETETLVTREAVTEILGSKYLFFY